MAKPLDENKFTLTDERRDLAILARVAEGAQRYDDMWKFMRRLVLATSGQELTDVERALLQTANKGQVGARRESWRSLNVDDLKDNPLVAPLRAHIESELRSIIEEMLMLLEKHLIPSATLPEACVSYLKQAADQNRYMAEFDRTPAYIQKAGEFYQKASDLSLAKLAPIHPLRLGVHLNYSVHLYEMAKDSHRAREVAQKAFDDAICKMDKDKVEGSEFKDSTVILQLIRDNLELWGTEQ
jgi:14-3-3 protein epsilon